MAKCNHNLVSMPFMIFSPLLIISSFITPNKVKEDSVLSEHFSVSNVVVSSLCCQLIWEFICG